MKTTPYPKNGTSIDVSLTYFLRKQAYYLKTVDKTHYPYIIYCEILTTQDDIDEMWVECKEEIENEIKKEKIMDTGGKWEVNKIEDRILNDDIYDIICDNSNGRVLICRTIQSNSQNLANAKRICQMNNSFDGLLEACKLIYNNNQEFFERTKNSILNSLVGLSEEEVLALKSAIAQAEGEIK